MNGHSDLTLVAEYLSLTHTYILWWIDDRTDVHIRSTQNSLNPPSYGAWKQNNDYLKNLMAREFIFLSKESQLTPKKEKKKTHHQRVTNDVNVVECILSGSHIYNT